MARRREMLAKPHPVAQTAENDPWTAAMRAGDFARAWDIGADILRRRVASGETCWHWPRHLQYVWRGDPLAGRRVLVRCYHGLGDTLQFIRFAAPLARRARAAIYWVQPALCDFVAGVRGVQRVLPLHDGVAQCDFDIDIELMELPHALRISADSLAVDVPYLPIPGGTPRRRREPGAALEVGLCWSAGDWDARRSIDTAQLTSLAELRGVRLHSLQYPPASSAPLDLPQLGCRDIGELARRMSTLDLVISVDTMVAHLAGGLGMPV